MRSLRSKEQRDVHVRFNGGKELPKALVVDRVVEVSRKNLLVARIHVKQ